MISHLSLREVKKLSPSISLQSDADGYQFLIINHAKFEAAFTLQGAHLIHFQATQQPPLIYLSKAALFQPHKAIRGGIPICWPWFGSADNALGTDLPSHGFARTSLWDVNVDSDDQQGTEITFTFAANKHSRQQWPHEFLLTLTVKLDEQISLALHTQNTGDHDFTYGGALHTYLHVKAIQACKIQGLATQYTDSLDGGKNKVAPEEITINAELDAIHPGQAQEIIVNDEAYQRNIIVTTSGNDSVVAWNPWINKAKRLTDMPDDGYQSMLCLESAITASSGVVVSPGQTHCLATTIQQGKQ